MSGWRIASWDRELARGAVASELGELPFDAAVALIEIEIDELASVSAYALGGFARDCPDIAKHWPTLDPTLTVFRFEPRAFGAKAGYVVARGIRLEPVRA